MTEPREVQFVPAATEVVAVTLQTVDGPVETFGYAAADGELVLIPHVSTRWQVVHRRYGRGLCITGTKEAAQILAAHVMCLATQAGIDLGSASLKALNRWGPKLLKQLRADLGSVVH